jgi:hypothetical protein
MSERCPVCDREGCKVPSLRAAWLDLVRERDIHGCRSPDAVDAYRVFREELEVCDSRRVDWRTRALAAESRVAAGLAECADWRDWTGTGNERESALVKCAVETVAVKLRGEVG